MNQPSNHSEPVPRSLGEGGSEFITIGSALEDVAFLIDPKYQKEDIFKFYEDKKVEVKESRINYGGGGMNSAIVLSKLGLRIAPLIHLGNDVKGANIVEKLARLGINTDLVRRSGECSTGMSVVLLTKKEGKHVIFVSRGANLELEVSRDILSEERPTWIYVSSLQGEWISDLENIFKAKGKLGFKVAWNPGQSQLKENPRFIFSHLGDVDILLLNRKEARYLIANGGDSSSVADSDTNELARFLVREGAGLVAITEGVEGATLRSSSTGVRADILKVDSEDATGAGDAFGATLAGMIYKTSGDIEQALRFAIAQSACVTTHVGAQKGLMPYNRLEKLAAKVKIEKL